MLLFELTFFLSPQASLARLRQSLSQGDSLAWRKVSMVMLKQMEDQIALIPDERDDDDDSIRPVSWVDTGEEIICKSIEQEEVGISFSQPMTPVLEAVMSSGQQHRVSGMCFPSSPSVAQY